MTSVVYNLHVQTHIVEKNRTSLTQPRVLCDHLSYATTCLMRPAGHGLFLTISVPGWSKQTGFTIFFTFSLFNKNIILIGL